MSDAIIALVVPAVMIAVIFAWVPLLNLVCPPYATCSGRQILKSFADRPRSSSLFASRIGPSDLAQHRHEFE
jgi:hypothetical protein